MYTLRLYPWTFSKQLHCHSQSLRPTQIFDSLYNCMITFHLLPLHLGQFISDSLLFLGFKVQFPAEANILIIQVVHPPTQLPVSASPIAGRNV